MTVQNIRINVGSRLYLYLYTFVKSGDQTYKPLKSYDRKTL